jgi:hypothetical protein
MAFCDQCGQRLEDRARFCPNCGAPRNGAAAAEPEAPPAEPVPPALEPDPSPPPPPTEARPRSAAQAELVGQLGQLGQTPAVVAAGVIGLGTFAVVFVGGFILAALPDASLIGFLGADAGYVTEAFRQMVQLVLAGFENDSVFDVFRSTSRVAPGLFALVPTLTALYLARAQLTRLRGSTLGLRLGVAAGGALLFALLMIIPALLTGDIGADVGQTFSYALLWGLIGALTGTVLAAPPERGAVPVPGRARAVIAAVLTALRPLALALLVTTVIGTAIWLVDVASDRDTRGSRSLPIALVDTALYAVDHGVHSFELGTLAAFERRHLQPEVLSLPLPADKPGEIIGTTSEPFRLFAYRDGSSAIVFLLMLVVLIGITVSAALYAGFVVARERAAASPALGAAWGALVGPVWAIALALINGLLQDTLFGHAQGESVFGIVLVFGALIGALGGFLAARASVTPASA